jgi:hypothetical protein
MKSINSGAVTIVLFSSSVSSVGWACQCSKRNNMANTPTSDGFLDLSIKLDALLLELLLSQAICLYFTFSIFLLTLVRSVVVLSIRVGLKVCSLDLFVIEHPFLHEVIVTFSMMFLLEDRRRDLQTFCGSSKSSCSMSIKSGT